MANYGLLWHNHDVVVDKPRCETKVNKSLCHIINLYTNTSWCRDMSRFGLDSSGSSTNQRIQTFIKETDLSDSSMASVTGASSSSIDKRQLNTINEESKNFDDQLDEYQLNLPIHHEDEEEEDDSDDGEKQNFHKNVKYLINQDFQVPQNESMVAPFSPANSIPNTFKNKSHPNARTKSQLGLDYSGNEGNFDGDKDEGNVEDANEDDNKDNIDGDSAINNEKFKGADGIGDVLTSTIDKDNLDKTPDWMPVELNERWADEFHSSVKINKNPSLTFQIPSTTNSVVHNSKNSLKTPMWKKVKGNYDQNKLQPHLQQFFNTSDKSHSMSSTLSTPYNSIKHNQLTKEQVTELQNLLEHGRDKPDDYVMEFPPDVSPLKLWGNNYNTFTKGKLNEIIHNLQAPSFNLNTNPHNLNLQLQPQQLQQQENNNNDILEQDSIFTDSMPSKSANDIAANNRRNMFISNCGKSQGNQDSDLSNEITSKPLPKLKTKTLNNTDLDQHYKQRANDLFDNIQKRGVILKPSNSKSVSNNFHQINNTTTATATATSTPKLNKINNDDLDAYSSFSSGFDQDSTQFNNNNISNANNGLNPNASPGQYTDTNEYTSLTESNTDSETPHPLSNDIKSVSGSHLNSPSSLHQSPKFESPRFQSSPRHQLSPRNLSYYSSPKHQVDLNGLSNDNNSSYTFEQSESSDIESSNFSMQAKEHISKANDDHRLELENKIKKLETKLTSLGMYQNNMEALINENNNLRLELQNHLANTNHLGKSKDHNKENIYREEQQEEEEVSIDEYDLTNELSQQEIKLKTLSQLRLQHLNNQNNVQNIHPRNLGILKPDPKLPNHYDNMVLDEKNHRWVPKENKENFSLDSIEDLVSDTDVRKQNSIIDQKVFEDDEVEKEQEPQPKTKEVSFHLPHSEQVKSSPLGAADTTRVSQLDEISFSQQQKRLVSIITENLIHTKTNWNKVIEISLLNQALFNIKDLNEFLPNILKVDLSHNNLKYLKGLPSNVINLNLMQNKIDNLTSFKDFLNLQHLDLSNNFLSNGHNLKYNIHLTKLTLNNNELRTMEGLNNLTNLISLDLSQNKLSGKVDFAYFKFENLQELVLSENHLEALVNVDKLTNLRILNVNENLLVKLACQDKHLHLKKLLLKFNRLHQLDLNKFPYLRTLRIDGNNFNSITGRAAKYLEDLSLKSQSPELLEEFFMNLALNNLKTLDLSGNFEFIKACQREFLNVNKLTLSAVNLSKLPENLADMFPNLMDLNLNFNQLEDLSKLKRFKHLKKLYLVSNSITKIELIVSNLGNCRLALKVLDLRLNAINVDFYPYLFNPQEAELQFMLSQPGLAEAGNTGNDNGYSPIQLETLDDIENFAIHYESLNNHNNTDWEIRDKMFINSLKSSKAKRRINYQTLLVNYFPNLKKLDGSIINFDKRLEFERNLKNFNSSSSNLE